MTTFVLDSQNWTLIGEDVSLKTSFQNQSVSSIYINFSANSDVRPVEEFGLIFDHREGVIEKSIAELNHTGFTNIWARTTGQQRGKVFISAQTNTINTAYVVNDYVDPDYVEVEHA